MNYKPLFHAAIRRAYPEEPEAIIADIEVRYGRISPDLAFAARPVNPIDRRLLFCGYFLATIQALEARGETEERIHRLCIAVAEAYVQPRNAIHGWVKRLPAQLMGTIAMRWVARLVAAKAGRRGHPEGFVARIITEPEQTYGLGYGVDIIECGICKLFARHGALRHVSILCEVDRLTASLAGLELVRSGTIAGGAEKCDFRFRRRASAAQFAGGR